MAVEIVVGGTYLFLDSEVDPFNLWELFIFVYVVETNL